MVDVTSARLLEALNRTLISGDVRSAVDICIQMESWPEALILAANSSPDVKQQIYNAYFQTCRSETSKMVKIVATQNWSKLATECDLKYWESALITMYSRMTDLADFTQQAIVLGARLESTQNIGFKKAALICYGCTGRADLVTEGWKRLKKTTSVDEEACIMGEITATIDRIKRLAVVDGRDPIVEDTTGRRHCFPNQHALGSVSGSPQDMANVVGPPVPYIQHALGSVSGSLQDMANVVGPPVPYIPQNFGRCPPPASAMVFCRSSGPMTPGMYSQVNMNPRIPHTVDRKQLARMLPPVPTSTAAPMAVSPLKQQLIKPASPRTRYYQSYANQTLQTPSVAISSTKETEEQATTRASTKSPKTSGGFLSRLESPTKFKLAGNSNATSQGVRTTPDNCNSISQSVATDITYSSINSTLNSIDSPSDNNASFTFTDQPAVEVSSLKTNTSGVKSMSFVKDVGDNVQLSKETEGINSASNGLQEGLSTSASESLQGQHSNERNAGNGVMTKKVNEIVTTERVSPFHAPPNFAERMKQDMLQKQDSDSEPDLSTEETKQQRKVLQFLENMFNTLETQKPALNQDFIVKVASRIERWNNLYK